MSKQQTGGAFKSSETEKSQELQKLKNYKNK